LAYKERYLSRKQVAEKLGISGWTWDAIRREESPPEPIRITRSIMRWKESEIDAWIERRNNEHTTDEEAKKEEGNDTEHDGDCPIYDIGPDE
jgi:predicted DNA-binding transcriptional regulator AlpA